MKSEIELGTKKATVEDPILEPYFISKDSNGGWAVSKKIQSKEGRLRCKDISYPGSFLSCLDCIAREKQNEEGKHYSSIDEYITSWKNISDTILMAYSGWNVKQI